MFLPVVKFSHPAIGRHLGCFYFLHSQTVLLGTFLNAKASFGCIPKTGVAGSKSMHTLNFKFQMILPIFTETRSILVFQLSHILANT